MRIWAVCKDPGGTAGLLPVVDELERRGHNIRLMANGKAAELLNKSGRKFEDWSDATPEEVIGNEPLPDVYVTTICERGGIGRDLVPLMRERHVPVVAINDFIVNGTGQEDTWLKPQFRPDFVTIDEIGRELLAKVWPDFDPSRIVITGFPAFDKYAAMDLEQTRRDARRKLGLEKQGLAVVSFAGGGKWTHLAHEILCRALSDLGPNYAIAYVPRPHPRTMNDFAEEAGPWQQCLAGLRHVTTIYDFFGQCSMTEVVAASDVVCSICSTVLMDAAVMRKVAISIMPPGPVKEDFRRGMGGITDQYPLVPLGCALEATTTEELAKQLEGFINGENPLREAQEANIKLDGKNTARVADLVESAKR